MERLDAAGRHPENQDPTKQFAIKQAKRFLTEARVKDPGPKTQKPSSEKTKQIDLGLEWQRQAQKLIDLGFHRDLGLSEETYLLSLPKFESQPEAFRGRFDIPVLVETRIDPARQAELAGLDYWIKGLDVSDWKDDPKGYKTPETPYTTWMQDGKKNLKRNVEDVRENLETDERGATKYDGVALFIAHPEILNDHYIDLPGTSLGADYAASLSQWNGKPRVYYDGRVGNAVSRFGSASCGRVRV